MKKMKAPFIAIIGAGASGLACAIEAARSNPRADITVYEAASRVGRKILATGNGRCNLTNVELTEHAYHGNISFARAVNEMFPPLSTIAFFNSIGLYTKTKQEGRVYPLSGQASSVLDALRNACEYEGVKTVCDCPVTSVQKHGNGFLLNGSAYADRVVLAAGGMVPAAKGDICNSFTLLRQNGHTVTPVYPALVQLKSDHAALKSLKGTRVDVTLTLAADGKVLRRESGELLFTDYGLSGIVAMQLSSLAAAYIDKTHKKPTVFADLAPWTDQSGLIEACKKICRSMPELPAMMLPAAFMPKRLGQMIVKDAGLKDVNALCGALTQGEIDSVCRKIKGYAFSVTGVKDFSFAQVTAGGADTRQFDENTLESKIVRGLFCCGEVLDVDGDCGGYNLQWAWASGRLAGRSAALLPMR